MKKTASKLILKLARMEIEFPKTLKGNERKVKSASDFLIAAHELIRICRDLKSVVMLTNETTTIKLPAIQIDSERSVLSLGKIVAIEGGPGSGKTTFLRKLAVSLLREGQKVIYVECSRVEAKNILAVVADHERREQDEGRSLNKSEVWKEVLDELARSALIKKLPLASLTKYVFVVDGLDELPSGLLTHVVGALISDKNLFKNTIISSRDTYESDLKGRVPVLRLSRFTTHERTMFFEKWFKDQPNKKDKALDLSRRNKDIAENARLPLVATLVAALIENDRQPETRLEIYQHR